MAAPAIVSSETANGSFTIAQLPEPSTCQGCGGVARMHVTSYREDSRDVAELDVCGNCVSAGLAIRLGQTQVEAMLIAEQEGSGESGTAPDLE